MKLMRYCWSGEVVLNTISIHLCKLPTLETVERSYFFLPVSLMSIL